LGILLLRPEGPTLPVSRSVSGR